MAATLTITLPDEVSEALDASGSDAERFVADAIRRELGRRRRAELSLSLDREHTESTALTASGLADWLAAVPAADVADLLDPAMAVPICWAPGEGWREGEE